MHLIFILLIFTHSGTGRNPTDSLTFPTIVGRYYRYDQCMKQANRFGNTVEAVCIPANG